MPDEELRLRFTRVPNSQGEYLRFYYISLLGHIFKKVHEELSSTTLSQMEGPLPSRWKAYMEAEIPGEDESRREEFHRSLLHGVRRIYLLMSTVNAHLNRSLFLFSYHLV